MVTRRQMLKFSGMAVVSAGLPASSGLPMLSQQIAAADYTLEIAPYSLQVSDRKTIKTTAYNQQVPGPLLRFKEGRAVTIDVINKSGSSEVVHWHGLFLPSNVDGAMEEGTPMIPDGARARYTFTPAPAGFRWYHTHVFAGKDLKRGQYNGEHGFLVVEGREDGLQFDQEIFLALHDWDGQLLASPDGAMDPAYDVSTINGRVLGFGEPLRVKPGQRVLLQILNSSPTEVHWIALEGHSFKVIALDGNRVPRPQTVSMLRLAPAERITALVEMTNPGVWVMGEVRKHIMTAGMGVVVEYAGSTGKPQWQQPTELSWDYLEFAATDPSLQHADAVIPVPLVFESKFAGHGAMDRWMINGKSYPETEGPALRAGQRYRLLFINRSTNDHPVHLHRHSFELCKVSDRETRGIMKDTVLVEAKSQLEVEFTADNPGPTLFHCHQQNHMDAGFMMLLHYA
jgi:FtsP/CotA-like multicopper oxidase with cupredoxin domain